MWIAFVIGLVVGANIGIIVMGLLTCTHKGGKEEL